MITRTLEDGTVVESMFLLQYEKMNELGEWEHIEELGKENAKATFDYADQLIEKGGIRNMQIFREDAI